MIIFIIFGILFLIALVIKIVMNLIFRNKTIKNDEVYSIVPGYINSDIPLKQALKNFGKMRQ